MVAPLILGIGVICLSGTLSRREYPRDSGSQSLEGENQLEVGGLYETLPYSQ